MTARLIETTKRIENVQQLETVVAAMRGISASRSQQARGLLTGLRAYEAVIAGAIGQTLGMLPPNQHRTATYARNGAIIVFAAEQGFAGAFNDRMLDSLDKEAVSRDIFLIGSRGGTLAAERGIAVHWHAAMVSHATLIAGLAGRIADALYDWLLDKSENHVEIIVPSWSPEQGVVANRRTLLPFDFRRFAAISSAQPPLISVVPDVLLGRLAEEYVFAELCEAALSAFAAENDARVAAMLAAKSNLETMSADLRGLARQIRQEEITAEVVELASGATARG
ncbi:MAG TPA: ATPase [Acetobacteraceae bacterium]|jgi:F-type H+-transporting ATPase subunit gamma|nr:ATPase [Acetobacteraceae bacterium]